MVRLVIFLVFFTALVMAAGSVLRLLGLFRESTAPTSAARPTTETPMPSILRNVAYALLLALMIGITTGWLGGL